MPVFEIENPDGSAYQVEAPDMESAIEAVSGMSGKQMGTGEDMARSAVSGFGQGTMSMIGTPGDLQGAVSAGAGWLSEKTGIGDPESMRFAMRQFTGPRFPNTEEISGAVNNAIRPAPGVSQLVTGEQPRSIFEHDPQTTAGKYAGAVSKMLPAAALGPGSWGMRAISAIGAGLGSEGAGQLTKGTPWEALARTGGAFAGGLAGGGGYSLATRPRIAGQTKASTQMLRDALPDDLNNFRQLGDEAMTIDASPAMTGLAQGVMLSPGQNRNAIVNALTTRNAGRSNRLIGDTEGTLGQAVDPGLLKRSIQEATERQTGPMYRSAKENAPNITLGDVLGKNMTANANEMLPTHRQVMYSIMDDINDALRVNNPKVTVERLHSIRKNLDAQIVYDKDAFNQLSSADKALQFPLKEARKAVDELLKERVPGYIEADELVSQSKRLQSDIDYGRDVLEGGKYASTPERLRFDLRDRNRGMVGEGMKADIRTSMGTQANDLPALRKKVGGENDFNREKIAEVFGQRSVDRLTNAVNREETFARSFADVSRNSQTAQRQGAAKALEQAEPRLTGQETITGLGLKGLGKMASSLLRRAQIRSSQSTRDALVQALLARGPEANRLLRDLAALPRGGSLNVTRAIVLSLLGPDAPLRPARN